ncbi:MAG: hypothetical protein JNL32_03605 [Candidatus Kapabacteria bacterium]|nr:hypothetical protein [Candidatus Kapabacteria bacterium]
MASTFRQIPLNPATCAERLLVVLTENGGPTMMSRMLGLRSASFWHSYLNGKHLLGSKLGEKIQAATGVRWQWIRTGEGTKYVERT